VPVVRPPETEAAALGAARQARRAVDGLPVRATASVPGRFDPTTSPDPLAATQRADALRDIALGYDL
jgi:hypothetical protein